MAVRLLFKSSVRQDLKQLEKTAAERLLRELRDALTRNPTTGEPLHGEFRGLYKLRIGDYRVIYTRSGGTFLVLRIRHRSKAYA